MLSGADECAALGAVDGISNSANPEIGRSAIGRWFFLCNPAGSCEDRVVNQNQFQASAGRLQPEEACDEQKLLSVVPGGSCRPCHHRPCASCYLFSALNVLPALNSHLSTLNFWARHPRPARPAGADD